MTHRTIGLLWPRPHQLDDSLTPHQRATLAVALTRPVAVLGGSPGTGKTFALACIIRAVRQLHAPRGIAVVAPTGKAAVRITGALHANGVRGIEASTIHQLLEIGRNGFDGQGWGFARCKSNPLVEQFVFVDEGSMLDTGLAASLVDACGPGTHLLIVGDIDQLPPVGHGAPLRDLIASEVASYGELREIRRNSGAIVEACVQLKAGDLPAAQLVKPRALPAIEPGAVWHIEAATPSESLKALHGVIDTLASRDGIDPVWSIQVLTATNASNAIARKAINADLATRFFPGRSAREKYVKGDKVICLRNHLADGTEPNTSHYVANGDLGSVREISANGWVHAGFTDPPRVIRFYAGKAGKGGDGEADEASGKADDKESDNGERDRFDLAYAITVHKSQGSEWPVVIVMLDSSYAGKMLTSREWIYTAISRAKLLCVTIGQRAMLRWMAKRRVLGQRKTFLKELLTGELEA